MLVATLLVNGSAEGFGRLFERTLLRLGMPTAPDPIVWFAAIGLVASALGATALRLVEARIDGVGVARRVYVTACAVGAVGLVVFAHAPSAAAAMAGSLCVGGLGFPTIRLAGTILVNRRATSDVRATVHSLLSQSENLGEVVVGVALACLAGSTSATVVLMSSAVLLGLAGVVVARSRSR